MTRIELDDSNLSNELEELGIHKAQWAVARVTSQNIRIFTDHAILHVSPHEDRLETVSNLLVECDNLKTLSQLQEKAAALPPDFLFIEDSYPDIFITQVWSTNPLSYEYEDTNYIKETITITNYGQEPEVAVQ